MLGLRVTKDRPLISSQGKLVVYIGETMSHRRQADKKEKYYTSEQAHTPLKSSISLIFQKYILMFYVPTMTS